MRECGGHRILEYVYVSSSGCGLDSETYTKQISKVSKIMMHFSFDMYT